MKRIVLLLLLIAALPLQATEPPSSRAQGIFLSFGVGPRVPVFNFAEKSIFGQGFNVEIAYADNESLPFFVFARMGFDQFPGAQDYYQVSDHTEYSVNYLPMSLGARYYFAPISDEFFLSPIVEVAATWVVFQESHQYKLFTSIPNSVNDGSTWGFTVSGGASMFIMDFTASYNYYNPHHFLSLDMRVRIPLFVTL